MLVDYTYMYTHLRKYYQCQLRSTTAPVALTLHVELAERAARAHAVGGDAHVGARVVGLDAVDAHGGQAALEPEAVLAAAIA